MPKSADQKLKLVYLIDFFNKNTDENHPAAMGEIIDFLEANGIHAERKSIYSDIEALNRLGYSIEQRRENPRGYYMSDRRFELAELKLLVDAVQSSKFITEKKSNDLIEKIEKLTSKYEGYKLHRQEYVANRVKTDNETILYNIDPIHEAIATNRRIKFNYCEWNLNKELVFRNDGKEYIADPVTLIWDDENYYMVAYDVEKSAMKHYRVDKIRNTVILDEKRTNNVNIKKFDPALYVREHFGMFSGNEETLHLRFENELIGVIIDRFGKDIPVIHVDDNVSDARIKVQVSDTFFGWIAGFRGRIMIEGNETVKQQFITFIEDIRHHF